MRDYQQFQQECKAAKLAAKEGLIRCLGCGRKLGAVALYQIGEGKYECADRLATGTCA